jgi:NAD(P)H-flavin reductase
VDENATKYVLIDGPYGQNLRLHRFESILLFATGTGVTGLISIVAEIFKSPERSPVNLRQIVLIWELDYIRE